MALTQISTEGIKDGTITGSDLATNVDLVDDQKLRFGTGNDLEIYGIASDGTAAIINHANGDLLIKHGADKQLISRDDGSVELYYDDSKKFETTSTGATLTGDLTVTGTFPKILLTDTDHNPDYSIINANGEFKIFSETDSVSRIKIKPSGTVEVINDLQIPNDTGKIQLGTSQDLEIFFDGTHSRLKHTPATGDLVNQSDDIYLTNAAGNEYYFRGVKDAHAELYHNNTSRLQTTSTGINISGAVGNGFVLTGSLGGTEQFKIANTSSGDYIQMGLQQQDSDGLHHRAFFIARKGTGSVTGQLELLARGAGGGTNRGLFIDAGADIQSSLTFRPSANNTYDLGTTSNRWRNVYTNDLNLSNEGGGGNDVDGTTGNYTIQEGADELYLINNKSGKKYKFNLTEVS